jgi:hypothetical protein
MLWFRCHNTEHTDTRRNDITHYGLNCDIQCMPLGMTTLSISLGLVSLYQVLHILTVILSVVMLSVVALGFILYYICSKYHTLPTCL